MLYQLNYLNTLTMLSILFLVLPLRLVAGHGVRNATSVDGSNHDLPTFFSTASRQNKIMAFCRLNHGRLFFQIPPWIKEVRVISSGNVTAFSFGHALRNMSRNALLTAPYNENKRGTCPPFDPKMIQTALTERTIHVYGSQIPYLKNYSRCTQSQPSAIPGGRELEIVLRERLNVANMKNESAIRFWIFFDCKANAFPNAFTSFRLVPRSTSHRKLKQLMNQKSADASVDVLAPLAPAIRAMPTAMPSTNVDNQKKNDNFVVTYFGRATQRKNEKDKDSVPSDDESSEKTSRLALRSIPPLDREAGTEDRKRGRSVVVVSFYRLIATVQVQVLQVQAPVLLKVATRVITVAPVALIRVFVILIRKIPIQVITSTIERRKIIQCPL